MAKVIKTCLFLLLSLNVACGGPWVKVGGLYEAPSHNFSVDIPQGWKRFDTDKYLLITKENAYLHYILIQQRNIDRPFKHTEKRLKHGMLSQEIAEVIIDEISSDQLVRDFKVEENVPVRISLHDGFKLVFNYRTEGNLTHKTIYYGFLKENYFYSIRYNTSGPKHLEKDREAFKKILNSFKLLENQATSKTI